MVHTFATAGIGSAWGFIAVFGFLLSGIFGMVIAAAVCLRKKSLKAGILALAIIAIQAAIFRPWHIEKPINADDLDQIEDARDAQQIAVVWFGFSAISVALLAAALLRRGTAPDRT
jgi:hypothetical protein